MNQNPPLEGRPREAPVTPPPLSEGNFIQNGWTFTSLPFWVWLFLIAVIAALILGSEALYEEFLQKEKREAPFFEVTNREFSVFLWQFPSFMRMNVSRKVGYLPGFFLRTPNIDPATSEEFIVAPPEVLFLYHTWLRLLYPEFVVRPIPPKEFEAFLEQMPEWKPLHWPKAPAGYVEMVNSRSYMTIGDLQRLEEAVLPLVVRQVFQGWKNYFIEGAQIDSFQATFATVKRFVQRNPHYARNYWRNIESVNSQEVAGPHYLEALLGDEFSPDALFPEEQLPSFVKVDMFNVEQAGALK